MEHNACISLLSSRTKCLPFCLRSIHDHFNKRYNYPIYVHYFDDIYDRFDVDVPNVEFISVPYESPIPEEEMFYHRDNNYARKFGIDRKGYLHMCNFIVNMYKYPNTKIHEHDYVMVFDDESGFVKELPFNPIDKMKGCMAASITGQRLNDGEVPQNHIDTREGLRKFCFFYSPEFRFSHKLPWSDGYVIKTDIFETIYWKKWVNAVNKSGGIYKYRWGDNEIYSLFSMICLSKPMQNLRLVEDGYLKQDLFRKIQNMAPGVKDNNR